MKVLACGSRHFADPFRASLAIDDRMSRLPAGCEVIHGGAIGADQMAAAAAFHLGLTVTAFLPDYRTHGPGAPFVRNVLMLEQQPELVLAFWDGQSRGTAHTIVEAGKRRIPVEIVALK